MIRLKSEKDIVALTDGGKILGGVLDELERMVKPGVLPIDLDAHARKRFAEEGVVSSFLNHQPAGHDPYPAALCVSVNDAVVHGIPGTIPIEEGDLVGLDLGLIYKEKYYLDSARTVGAGAVSSEGQALLDLTQKALAAGIAAAQPGGFIGDIGAAVQSVVDEGSYGIVRQLVGHGVGFAVWEEPQVPNWGERGVGIRLEPGFVIAIEPMLTVGPNADVFTADDGWTVVTEMGELSAQFEHTIVIEEEGPRILTQV